MEYRTRKKITIGAAYLVLFAVIIIGFYYGFIYKAPTCSDGVKNQNEEEVDCGGVCALCYDFSNIEVVWVQAVPAGTGFYDVAAKIKNPNPNDGLSILKYHFELKNTAGEVIWKQDGATFILPNASKYIIETNIPVDEPAASAGLSFETIEKTDWQRLKDYQTPDVYVKDKGFTIAPGQPYAAEATGVVQNNTDFGFDKVFIGIVLFGADNGKIAGVSKTEVRTLLSGEGRYFSTRWFYPISGVATADMEAEVNLFLSENYMRAHSAPAQ